MNLSLNQRRHKVSHIRPFIRDVWFYKTLEFIDMLNSIFQSLLILSVGEIELPFSEGDVEHEESLSAVKEVNRSVKILALVCIISFGRYSKPRIVFLSPVPE